MYYYRRMALTRLRLVVSGRVQGVGYRWFVYETARRLGVTGWTRNCDDGTVEIEAEGGDTVLEELIAEIRTGNPMARVDGLKREQIAARGEKMFEIRS
jgi:acylphosphatase